MVFISSANANKATTFEITDVKLSVQSVTSSFQDNAKLLQHLKSSFERTINQKKTSIKSNNKGTRRENQYLEYVKIH